MSRAFKVPSGLVVLSCVIKLFLTTSKSDQGSEQAGIVKAKPFSGPALSAHILPSPQRALGRSQAQSRTATLPPEITGEQVYEVLLVVYYQDLNTHYVILSALRTPQKRSRLLVARSVKGTLKRSSRLRGELYNTSTRDRGGKVSQVILFSTSSCPRRPSTSRSWRRRTLASRSCLPKKSWT